MVDQDPLPRWTHGRVTLLGDAAHPMVPRGSNGAGQAILDARCLAGCCSSSSASATAALNAYDAVRVKATTQVVLTNRSNPPDTILREVYRAHGRQALRAHRGRDHGGGAAGAFPTLQAGRRLRSRGPAKARPSFL